MEICLSSSITGQQQLLPSHGRTKLPKPAIHTISIYAYSEDVQNRTRMTIHPHFILFSLHPLFNSIFKSWKKLNFGFLSYPKIILFCQTKLDYIILWHILLKKKTAKSSNFLLFGFRFKKWVRAKIKEYSGRWHFSRKFCLLTNNIRNFCSTWLRSSAEH